jgi:hypothetical protein
MSKALKLERIIYAAIMGIFLISCAFKIIPVKTDSGTIWNNYYYEVFSDTALGIYGNIFLGIPMLAAVLSIGLGIGEIISNKINFGLEATCGACYFLFFACGMLFASIQSAIYPYGMIVFADFLAIIIVRIIFHYGVKHQVV